MNLKNKINNKVIAYCNKIVLHTHWYQTGIWNGASKFWSPIEFNLDILCLGSGFFFNDLDFQDSEIKGFNAALWPQSLVHDFNILKNYFSYIREGGTVIIGICPFSGLFSPYGKSHNLKYYTFLHPATIINFEEEERVKALHIKHSPFTYMPKSCIGRTLTEILSNIKHKASRRNNKLDFIESAESMMKLWKKQFGISDLSAPLSQEHLNQTASRRETLRQMIEFCKERSLNPVIVIHPLHKSLSELFPAEFDNNYFTPLLQGLDVKILSYFRDENFQDDSLYKNSFFLNRTGARIFTAKVVEDIKSWEAGL